MARSHMNMPIICVRSFCGVNEVPDFTNCKRVPGRAYNGANGKKIAIEHQGEQYMLKFPPSGQGKRTELSYTNSCISEHIASTIFNMVGIPAQETILGTYDVGGKTKIVCACKDFTADGSKLFDFCSIKNTVIDSEYGGTGTELEDILDTIEKQQYVNPVEVLQHFWNVFVVDALLGNFDRHNGNWGFLYHDDTQTATLAPIYDCGSCLLPQADAQVMRAVLSNQDELNARIYRFPTSAIKQNDRKINYYYRFETTSRRAEYLDRKIERTYRQLTRLLDEPERKLLLKMADLEDALREEACLNSFISGYRLAQGIQQELLADHPPYNFENEDEQRACELAGKEG